MNSFNTNICTPLSIKVISMGTTSPAVLVVTSEKQMVELPVLPGPHLPPPPPPTSSLLPLLACKIQPPVYAPKH